MTEHERVNEAGRRWEAIEAELGVRLAALLEAPEMTHGGAGLAVRARVVILAKPLNPEARDDESAAKIDHGPCGLPQED